MFPFRLIHARLNRPILARLDAFLPLVDLEKPATPSDTCLSVSCNDRSALRPVRQPRTPDRQSLGFEERQPLLGELDEAEWVVLEG